jgi:hypothetical protein
MSTLSRFDLTLEDLKKPLPPLQPTASIDAKLQQLTEDICRLDPQLAEIAFSLSFPAKSREEKLAQIRDWAKS